jgi:hypothetical protein
MTETRKPNRPSHTLFMVEGEKDNAVSNHEGNKSGFPRQAQEWIRACCFHTDLLSIVIDYLPEPVKIAANQCDPDGNFRAKFA